MNHPILQFLLILSEMIEATYSLGTATRRYVLPVVIYVIVAAYHYGTKAWDYLTAQELELHVIRTPLTTGLA